MKKLLIILLSVVMVSSLFAVDTINPSTNAIYTKSVVKPFTKTSARMEAMGGAGIAGFSNQDALYVNPASLGKKGLVFNTPNVALTIYNFKDIVGTGVLDDLINNSQKFSDSAYMTQLGQNLLSIYGTGLNNALLGLDAGVGFKFGRFAFALDTKTSITSYTPGGNSSIQLIPTLDAVLSVGLGLRFFEESSVNLDIGVATRLNVRGYSKAFSADDIFSHMSDMGSYFGNLANTTPLMVGFAVPIDAAINVNLPAGFTISSVVKNINGKFYMSGYENYQAVLGKGFGVLNSGTFSFDTPMSVNLGIGWNPDFGKVSNFINTSILVDMVDLVTVFKEFGTTSLLRSLRIGAELELLRTFEIRAGLNQGYITLGAGINLFNVIHLEASYYWNEFGKLLGDNSVDAFTIRANLFWER